MVVGFCYGVLNIDNMLIIGESFDYGLYFFIFIYNFKFIVVYFDYFGFYCYSY